MYVHVFQLISNELNKVNATYWKQYYVKRHNGFSRITHDMPFIYIYYISSERYVSDDFTVHSAQRV